MHNLDRCRFVFAEGLLEPKSRPVDMFDSPVNKLALECLGDGPADAAVLGGILHGALRRPNAFPDIRCTLHAGLQCGVSQISKAEVRGRVHQSHLKQSKSLPALAS